MKNYPYCRATFICSATGSTPESRGCYSCKAYDWKAEIAKLKDELKKVKMVKERG